jgi:hypothetical protein
MQFCVFTHLENRVWNFFLTPLCVCVYQQTTKDEIRTVCSSLKQLESEAAYKLQVLACGGDAECGDSLGPASAILHFTTQTNSKRFCQIKKIGIVAASGGRRVVRECICVGCQSAMISPDGQLDQDTLQLAGLCTRRGKEKKGLYVCVCIYINLYTKQSILFVPYVFLISGPKKAF